MRASDASAVRHDVESDGLTVLEVRPARGWPELQRVRRKDLAVVFRNVSILVADGVPIERALATSEVLVRGRLCRSIEQVRARVRSGSTIAEALEADTGVFPRSVAGIMRAGERASRLEQACETIADQLEAETRLRSELWGALAYPVLVLLVGVASIVVMGGVVVPRFGEVFAGMGSELPPTTRALVASSDFLRYHGVWLLLGALGLLVLLAAWSRTSSAQDRVDELLLRFPVVGRLRHGLSSARTCRALGGMLTTGMPLLSALDTAKEAAGDREIARRLGRARESVVRGGRLTDALADEEALTPFALQLVSVGESGGKLGPMITRAGDIVAEQTQVSLRALISLVEPVLIISLGGLVAGVAAALLQAVYSVSP